MPVITIQAEDDQSGVEETISEYMCDEPGCPNIGVHVVGVIEELDLPLVVCEDHAKLLNKRGRAVIQSEQDEWEAESAKEGRSSSVPVAHPWF